jgi:hypothetical protein
MKSRTPEQAGYTQAGPLEPLGRARCFSLLDAPAAVLLRIEPGDEARATFRWGMARGIGAFYAAGEDTEGAWFVRGSRGLRFDRFLKRSPGPEEVLKAFGALAGVLAQCEEKGLFPGPLLPENIELSETASEVVLLAGDWVALTLGASPEAVSPEPHRLRFFPPAPASGAAWDAAANRYAFGLMFYEALAGEPAFAGQGLRLSLEQRAERAPAAFSVERARALLPGIQSLCLRLLDPDEGKRPDSAREIARELGRIQRGRVDQEAPAGAETERESKPARPASARHVRAPRFAKALALGLAVASVVFALFADRDERLETWGVGSRALLTTTANAETCASCHPRHASEWRGSVMAHAATSPLFQSLEQLITEQVGRSRDCPDGAGILRPAGALACRDGRSGVVVTGSGGEGWCSNCHLPKLSLGGGVPAFRALEAGSRTHQPLAELVPEAALEGISCTVCHQAQRPVSRRENGEYTGNASWISTDTGARFDFRPEAGSGIDGIANSGAYLNPAIFSMIAGAKADDLVPSGAHRRTSERAKAYQRSSEFCGSCHDVRLFGTDVLAQGRGEHFKRLRNAYSEWVAWRDQKERRGERAASCVDCHLSTFPGVCAPEPGAPARDGCPPGTRFESRAPGTLADGFVATNSEQPAPHHPHYFTGVEVPLDPRHALPAARENAVDAASLPLDPRARRDLLLASAVSLEIAPLVRRGSRLSVPIRIENVGAGHRVPAGFSQERELWVELSVRDARGRVLYQVGRVARPDEDLRDKVFTRVTSDDRSLDAQGRPLGLFGADVSDGPDVPRWSPPPELGGTRFRGRGLVNFQNGFLRCVSCIGRIGADGHCEALPGQEGSRAARFEDAPYDQDTGECRSNLTGREALFETFFPVGALDARRGILKAPDAIIDTRSLAPEEPVEYVYELDVGDAAGPLDVEARLLFRAFPPFLLRAFIEYERLQDARGKRPSGPLIDERALERLDIVEVRRASRAGGAA